MQESLLMARRASLLRVRAYIDSYSATPISIERMSREAGFSPYHFIRLFQRAYRQTPHQYLVQRRIQKAKALLRSTDLSVTDICSEVGFESLGSFSTLFRRDVGLSPSAYRERCAAAPAMTPKPAMPIPLCYRIHHGLDGTLD